MNIAPPAQHGTLTHAEVVSIIVGVMLAMFLGALDQTIVATAMPTIGRALGDAVHLPWVVTAYLLAATAVTPLYGKFSDVHGRRITLLVGIGIFIIGSVLCALAPTMLTLIIGRFIQGLGGGGLIALAQTIMGDITSPKERSRYQAFIASVFLSASVLGPLLGGFFADKLHWSLIFWINLPLGLAAFLMTYRLLRKLPRHERKHRIDVLGGIILLAATVSLMLLLNWGGITYPWLSREIIGLGVLSVVFWIAFVVRLHAAPEPFLPLSLLKNQVVRTGNISTAFSMGSFIGLSIYLPVYLQTVYGFSAGATGVVLIPLMAGTVCGAFISGALMPKVRHYKRLPIVGLSFSTLGLIVLALHPEPMPLIALEAIFIVVSVSLGTSLPVTTISIQNAVPLYQLGMTMGLMNFARQLGGAIAVAIFGAIVFGLLLHGGGAGGGAGMSHENLSAAFSGSTADFAPAFRWVFVAAAVCLGVALLALIRMEERPLRSTIGETPPHVME
ncbi:MDR family MFS transporter [Chelatococcus asaccharovorans]|uniref:MDR family MFS transporter n=1 Tax=Chelatococcus asaccharovorans TaxID=28210 RepID=UPI00224C76EF|nr:MDR family MFS transporter [Chelatococcus asaccharovorans]CAH1670171.1 EmrB/QacA subfamily drug resistance transporter [Chelatococcus asaccharovorans]CAH1678393.1 EmrB/QacA subfamily drug resistance transporter [Chelatococcus asaccharovorans]